MIDKGNNQTIIPQNKQEFKLNCGNLTWDEKGKYFKILNNKNFKIKKLTSCQDTYKDYEPFFKVAHEFYKHGHDDPYGHIGFNSWGKDKKDCYKEDYLPIKSQIIGEFFDTWEIIIKYIKKNNLKEITFLEIGAYNGLWGLMLSYIGKKSNIPYKYTGIDFNLTGEKRKNLSKLIEDSNCTIINADSHDPNTLKYIKDKYNIVFIDGDHSYEGVTSDIKMYSKLATNMVLFHDITSKDTVYKAINDSKIKLDEEISYQTERNHMGIGIKYIKNA
tara:strand:+ start:95 stop:916 length:822 start_codon:yes stop_codon:yes gene_type:complete